MSGALFVVLHITSSLMIGVPGVASLLGSGYHLTWSDGGGDVARRALEDVTGGCCWMRAS